MNIYGATEKVSLFVRLISIVCVRSLSEVIRLTPVSNSRFTSQVFASGVSCTIMYSGFSVVARAISWGTDSERAALLISASHAGLSSLTTLPLSHAREPARICDSSTGRGSWVAASCLTLSPERPIFRPISAQCIRFPPRPMPYRMAYIFAGRESLCMTYLSSR